jgi:hypothetical protein
MAIQLKNDIKELTSSVSISGRLFKGNLPAAGSNLADFKDFGEMKLFQGR